jgi:hypothetical protein
VRHLRHAPRLLRPLVRDGSEHAYHGVTTKIADLSPEEWQGYAPPHVARIVPPREELPSVLDRFLPYGETTTSIVNTSPTPRRDPPPVDD